jgi:hypothetical protein
MTAIVKQMKTPSRITSILLAAFCLSQSLTAMSHVPRSGKMPAQAERPNILFIFADDWGWGDLSCHGHSYVKTPNIDRLAAEGTDFQRFTVASGVCSPSRAATLGNGTSPII